MEHYIPIEQQDLSTKQMVGILTLHFAIDVINRGFGERGMVGERTRDDMIDELLDEVNKIRKGLDVRD